MTMKEFIKRNGGEIANLIEKHLNHVPRTASCYCNKSGTEHDHENFHNITEKDIRQWILNDEGLYNWARSEGVNI